MKIALVSDIYSFGGQQSCIGYNIASHVALLAEGLSRIGHKVMVAVPEISLSKPIVEGRVLRCSGKRSDSWAGVQISKSGESQLAEKLQTFQPDVIHVHTLSETGAFALAYARDQRIPSLLTVHTLEDLEKSGHTFSPIALMQEHKRIHTAQLLLETEPHILVTTDAMAQTLYQNKIHVFGQLFPAAIDTESFYPNVTGPFQRHTLADSMSLQSQNIVVCGGCDDDSIYPFLEEWAHTFSGEEPFQLLILNHESQTEELYSLIHSLHLSHRIFLSGSLSKEDLAACYEMSCCYLSCSQSEMLHVSAAEAAACGIPLLVRSGSGTASLVQDKQNGFTWSSESEAFELIRKFARVTGAGKEALTKMVSDTIHTLTPQNQAHAAESLYFSLFS